MTEKVTIKRVPKTDNLIEVKMVVTRGKVLSILHALEASSSAVGYDVRNMFERAATEAGVEIR